MLTPAFFPSLERHDTASRTDDRKQLSHEQWFLIEDLFDWRPPTRAGGTFCRAKKGVNWSARAARERAPQLSS